MISRRQSVLPAVAALAAVLPQFGWWLDHRLALVALLSLAVFGVVKPERETLLLLCAASLGVVAFSASIPHLTVVALLALAGIGVLSWPLGRNGVGGLAWIGLAVLVVVLAFGDNRTDEFAVPSPSTLPPTSQTTMSHGQSDSENFGSSTGTSGESSDQQASTTENPIIAERQRMSDLYGQLIHVEPLPSQGRSDLPSPRLRESGPEEPKTNWWATVVLLALALATHRLLNRTKALVGTHTGEGWIPPSSSTLTRRFERIGASLGLERGENETLLAYGRRLSESTDDHRFIRCSELLSSHLYGHEADTADLEAQLEELRAQPAP